MARGEEKEQAGETRETTEMTETRERRVTPEEIDQVRKSLHSF